MSFEERNYSPNDGDNQKSFSTSCSEGSTPVRRPQDLEPPTSPRVRSISSVDTSTDSNSGKRVPTWGEHVARLITTRRITKEDLHQASARGKKVETPSGMIGDAEVSYTPDSETELRDVRVSDITFDSRHQVRGFDGKLYPDNDLLQIAKKLAAAGDQKVARKLRTHLPEAKRRLAQALLEQEPRLVAAIINLGIDLSTVVDIAISNPRGMRVSPEEKRNLRKYKSTKKPIFR